MGHPTVDREDGGIGQPPRELLPGETASSHDTILDAFRRQGNASVEAMATYRVGSDGRFVH